MIRKSIFVWALSLVLLQLTACGGGGSGTVIPAVEIVSFTATENVGSSTAIDILMAENEGGIPTLSYPLDRNDLSSTPVTLNYMINEIPTLPAQDEKALIVFFSGGYMHTRVGEADISDVFVTRSAHLFAEKGYRTINIDHPTDIVDYYPTTTPAYDPANPPTDGEPNHYAWYDPYRISPDHCRDVKKLIEDVNASSSNSNLDIILIGYGRGAISAAAVHHNLTELSADRCDNAGLSVTWNIEAIVMLSPSTHGGSAFLSDTPVLTDRTYDTPVFIAYHSEDECIARDNDTAAETINEFRVALIQAGNPFDIMAVSGGFESPEPPGAANDPYEPCGALTHHGFLGVEGGTVNMITNWIDGKLGF